MNRTTEETSDRGVAGVPDERAEIAAQRRAIYELLSSLDERDWDHQSLCEGWRVRDVAVHVMTAVTMNPLRLMVGLVAHAFDFNRFMARYCPQQAERPVAELLQQFAAIADDSSAPPGTNPAQLAADMFIHRHDIALPLGLDVPCDPDRLPWLAEGIATARWPLNARARVRGLELRAIDTHWRHGTGPVVEGPTCALMLAVSGRRALDHQLSGDGLATLRSRR